MSLHRECMQQIQNLIRQNQVLRRQLTKTKKQKEFLRQSIAQLFKVCFSKTNAIQLLENFELTKQNILLRNKKILQTLVQNLEGWDRQQFQYKKGFTFEDLENNAIKISGFVKNKITQMQTTIMKITSQIKDAYQSQMYLKKQFNDAKLKIQQLENKINQLQIDLDTATAQLQIQKVENQAKSRKVEQLQSTFQANKGNAYPGSYTQYINQSNQQYDYNHQIFSNKF